MCDLSLAKGSMQRTPVYVCVLGHTVRCLTQGTSMGGHDSVGDHDPLKCAVVSPCKIALLVMNQFQLTEHNLSTRPRNSALYPRPPLLPPTPTSHRTIPNPA